MVTLIGGFAEWLYVSIDYVYILFTLTSRSCLTFKQLLAFKLAIASPSDIPRQDVQSICCYHSQNMQQDLQLECHSKK